jgi:general secretion pathway protein E
MPRVTQSLEQILIENGLILQEQLEAALEIATSSNRKLEQVLLERQVISQDTLASAMTLLYKVPVVSLSHFPIQREAMELIPEETAKEHTILPLSVQNGVLTLAAHEIDHLYLATLEAITNKKIRPVILVENNIVGEINTRYQTMEANRNSGNKHPVSVTPEIDDEPLYTDLTATGSVARSVDRILEKGVRDRASDIHIEPQENGVQVRYRIDGVLKHWATVPLGAHSALLSRIKVMSNMNIAERRRPQDGQFTQSISGRDVDFRVATIPTNYGEMMVLRVLDKSLSLFRLSQIGLSPEPLEQYKRGLKSPFGMVLVTGPTGSGKTTTLYASLNEFDAKENNIMTIEEPIEYQFENINQIQVNRKADLTFAAGLRGILRLDPDIILVGEVRDSETADTAIQSSMTGHLVLTSMHANDAVGALLRLIDFGVEPYLVTSAVVASVSQRLIRKICPSCAAPTQISPEDALIYNQETKENRTEFFYGKGCSLCAHTGYLSRTAVFEVLLMTDELRQLVARQASASDIRAQALRQGMLTMVHDGMLKARAGLTTPKEVIRNVFTIT